MDIKKRENVEGEDTKKKKYHHALTDDCTRILYVEVLPEKRSKTVTNFFERGTKWFGQVYEVRYEALLSDNEKEYTYHTESEKPYLQEKLEEVGYKTKSGLRRTGHRLTARWNGSLGYW
ncbi:DDE-type integrase/transposase/recombinase [Candidatus Bipolaricaulota bacterium]|nr:DDE-type integrase/transposase/recombinase [Candidatus Bipolaricaulota bacterium]